MKKPVVDAKGQVVIPAELRRKYGIKKGTVVSICERNGEIIIRPLTDEYIRSMAGILGTEGNVLKAFTKENAKERKREDADDRAAFRTRAREPNVPFEKALKNLKRRGLS